MSLGQASSSDSKRDPSTLCSRSLRSSGQAGQKSLSDFWLTITPPTPLFFVSAESKGLSDRVSLLFAILTRRSISVAAKGLMGANRWRKSNWVGWEDFGGVRRTSWPIEALRKREAIKGEAPSMAGAGATQEL